MLRQVIGVVIMAIVTYIPRVLPVSIFTRDIKSRYIKSVLYYVPYAVLSALTFPAIFYSTGNEITAILGTIVALLLAYFECGLVVVAVAAMVTVFLSGLLV